MIVTDAGKYHFKTPLEFTSKCLEEDKLWELSNEELDLHVYEIDEQKCIDSLEESIDDLFLITELYSEKDISPSSLERIKKLKSIIEVRK